MFFEVSHEHQVLLFYRTICDVICVANNNHAFDVWDHKSGDEKHYNSKVKR